MLNSHLNLLRGKGKVGIFTRLRAVLSSSKTFYGYNRIFYTVTYYSITSCFSTRKIKRVYMYTKLERDNQLKLICTRISRFHACDSSSYPKMESGPIMTTKLSLPSFIWWFLTFNDQSVSGFNN